MKRSNKTNAHSLSFLTLAILVFSASPARSQFISSDLQALASGAPVDVLVQYKQKSTDADDFIAKSLGATKSKDLGLIKAATYRMTTAAAVKLIARNRNIRYISPDRPVQGAMNFAVPAVNADLAQSLGFDGTGIGVAVIDSGVNLVGDLAAPATKSSRVVYSRNFDLTAPNTSDLYGHGTHVASIIAGNGANSSCSNCNVTFRGIAPNANIINLRVLDQNGNATDSTVIAAIQQAITLKNQYNIRIINLSLGRGI
jgi:serine protease AprX